MNSKQCGDTIMTTDPQITLKEYVDVQFKHVEIARQQAYASMDKRLDSMNEFRDTLRDQATKFVTQSEIDAKLLALDADIRYLREAKSLLEGKASQKDLDTVRWFSIVAVIGTLIGITMSIIDLVIHLGGG